MSRIHLNNYGLTRIGQVKYTSDLLNDVVLLVGESVDTPDNPDGLCVYWPACLDVVKHFVKLGGDPLELHGIKKIWPTAKLEKIEIHNPIFWDHSNLPMETVSRKRTTAEHSVFRLRESLSKESLKKLKRERYHRYK